MTNETNFGGIAASIFERTGWHVSDDDVDRLARNMHTLEQRGMSKLNRRLIDDRRVRDTLAEHNLATALAEHNPLTVPIEYEPEQVMGRALRRPPDFVVKRNGIAFWVQMKKLSMTERENRQAKAIDQIKKASTGIRNPRFFSCSLSQDFGSPDVDLLMNFISAIVDSAEDHREFVWTSPTGHTAEIAIWTPRKLALEHLTLGVSGDLEVLDVTGESSSQIRSSLENAAGAFDWDTADHDINLIAMEIGSASHGDIDVGDAVFGDEVSRNHKGKRMSWGRKGNGLFNSNTFGSRVAGVIVRRRVEHLPICQYRTILFINHRFVDRLGHIHSVVDLHGVIPFNQLIDHEG